MKSITKNINVIVCSLLIAVYSITGCTNLDEHIFHEIVPETYITGVSQLESIVYSTYVWFRLAATDRKWYLASELAADQISGTVKGTTGYDGGRQIELHHHTWTSVNECTESAWQVWVQLLAGANANLTIIKDVDYQALGLTQEQKNRNIAETIILRDMALYELMDMFGNIPAPEDDANVLPEQKTPAEVFAIIDNDINTYYKDLPKGWSPNTYGRVTQGVAKFLQARLYLNAPNYGVEAKWSECRDICMSFINGDYGTYELAANFYEAFDWNNQNSKEIVMGVSMDYTQTGRPEIFYTWHHRGIGQFYGFDIRGNNQIHLTPSLKPDGTPYDWGHNGLGTPFANYSDKDLRKAPANPDMPGGGGMFLQGICKSSIGTITGQYEYKSPKNTALNFVDQVARFADAKISGTPVTNLVSDIEHGEESSGIRWTRYRLYPIDDTERFMAFDYVWMRYTDIYYMLAECKIRLGEKGAAQYVNAAYKRNFNPKDYIPYTDEQLTLDEMLKERGREFLGESTRRRDLIRYGYFNLPWWDKPQTSANRKLFLIPQSALSANHNLKQNPE